MHDGPHVRTSSSADHHPVSALLTLEDVCIAFADCVNRTAPTTANGGYFAVGTPAMKGNVIDLTQAREISAETYATWTRRLTPAEGDLLIAREAPVGPIVRIPAGDRVAAGQRTTHVRANPSVVDPLYLYYLLVSPGVQSQMTRMSMGSTVPHLRVADVRDLPLPALPTLPVQKAIAEVLGALDDKIAANAKLVEAAGKLAASEYRAIVTASSHTEPVGNLMTLEYGKSLPTSRRNDGDIPVFGSGGVVGTHDAHLVHGPGVVVGRKGTAGSVHWSNRSFFPIDTTFYVTPRHSWVPMTYCYFALKSLRLDGRNSDSAVPGLNRSDAQSATVRVPSRDALLQFDGLAQALFDLAGAREDEMVHLARVRDTLLPGLMSGRITVNDAGRTAEEVL